jgi:2-polyprenyl-3-methyl-5-hydroxy-6-metoxy-1,4-benzoquinol methylase
MAAETYARWRATTLGSITKPVETKVVFALAGKRVPDVGTENGTYAIGAAARGALVTAFDSEQHT